MKNKARGKNVPITEDEVKRVVELRKLHSLKQIADAIGRDSGTVGLILRREKEKRA